jgi:Type II secretion system (T2SS), protein M subtype b
MIHLGLSAKDRRTAVFGVVVVGSLIGFSRGLPALAEWERVRVAGASDLVAKASAARASVRMLGTLRDSLRARQQQLAAMDSSMLTGTSAAAAAADLASSVDQIATASRLKVASMQLRADSAVTGALATVAVRVSGTTDVAGLAAFLRTVEANDAPLVVRELTVSQSEPAAPQSKPEALHVDVVVEGIARILAARGT